MTRILRTVTETRAAIAELAARAGAEPDKARLALVPTMGALHDGHRALIRLAREQAEIVIVSIFVNPLQFAPDEDLDRYPRTPEADLAVLEAEGVHAAFMPAVAEMYPDLEHVTTVSAGEAGRILEGEYRPTHFDGVLTVVAKLFNIIRPDIAVFGEKDAQQLALVRRMVRDLDFPLEIVAHPIVREADGLARSSRNAYLGEEERGIALTLKRALDAVEAAAPRGRDDAIAAGRAVYDAQALASMDYLELVDAATFAPIDDTFAGEALALTAARIGTTRLIDNRPVAMRH